VVVVAWTQASARPLTRGVGNCNEMGGSRGRIGLTEVNRHLARCNKLRRLLLRTRRAAIAAISGFWILQLPGTETDCHLYPGRIRDERLTVNYRIDTCRTL